MTKKEDFEKLIQERLKSLKKPVEAPEKDLKSDEGVDKDKQSKRLKKGKRKRNKGYVNNKRRK